MCEGGGSSPLTRGKHPAQIFHRDDRGLIPAHAGKTEHTVMPTRFRAAHPRSRGENALSPGDAVDGGGSSPLTRGKPSAVHAAIRRPGLIPAHAGKTAMLMWRVLRRRAHPRSRGENILPALEPLGGVGSSPLTRGKLRLGDNRRASRGLIPAHAGKTVQAATMPVPGPAHPRSRGENRRVRWLPRSGGGSSPLTRGKRRF